MYKGFNPYFSPPDDDEDPPSWDFEPCSRKYDYGNPPDYSKEQITQIFKDSLF